MIEMTIPSSLDPTIAPKGAHVALLFTQYFTSQFFPTYVYLNNFINFFIITGIRKSDFKHGTRSIFPI